MRGHAAVRPYVNRHAKGLGPVWPAELGWAMRARARDIAAKTRALARAYYVPQIMRNGKLCIALISTAPAKRCGQHPDGDVMHPIVRGRPACGDATHGTAVRKSTIYCRPRSIWMRLSINSRRTQNSGLQSKQTKHARSLLYYILRHLKHVHLGLHSYNLVQAKHMQMQRGPLG